MIKSVLHVTSQVTNQTRRIGRGENTSPSAALMNSLRRPRVFVTRRAETL